MSAVVQQFEHSLAFPFFPIGMNRESQLAGRWIRELCLSTHQRALSHYFFPLNSHMHTSETIQQGLQYPAEGAWKWKWSRSVVSDSLQPVDWSPPNSSIHGILQARILEWVAIFFSRGSSWPRDWTQVSHTAGRRFNLCTTREALNYGKAKKIFQRKEFYC